MKVNAYLPSDGMFLWGGQAALGALHLRVMLFRQFTSHCKSIYHPVELLCLSAAASRVKIYYLVRPFSKCGVVFVGEDCLSHEVGWFVVRP